MDGTEGTGAEPAVIAPLLRLVAGLLILVAMVAVAVLLLPPYLDNLRLQRDLAGFVSQSGTSGLTEDAIRAEVAKRAARLGLPLTPSQIRVEKDGSRVRVEAMYVVRVDLPLYSVDLHFRPAADARQDPMRE